MNASFSSRGLAASIGALPRLRGLRRSDSVSGGELTGDDEVVLGSIANNIFCGFLYYG